MSAMTKVAKTLSFLVRLAFYGCEGPSLEFGRRGAPDIGVYFKAHQCPAISFICDV